MKRFKILLIAPGDSIHSRRFAGWILENGGTVYFLDAINPFPEGIPDFYFISYPYRGNRKLRKWFGSKWGGRLSAWLNVPILWLIWHRIKPDLVHVHYVDHRAYQSTLAGHHPLVLSVWGSDINYQFLPDADPYIKQNIAEALSKARLIFVDAKDMIEKCQILVGQPIPCEMLNFGVDTQKFCPSSNDEARDLRLRYGISPETHIYLSIRGWNQYNNHLLVLEAYALARKYLSGPSCLVFKRFLSHPNALLLQEEILARSKALGLERVVHLFNEISDEQMPVLYNFADTIINYPSVDAFPVSFLEAAACERPVITSRLPAYEGTFAESCFDMVPPNDVEALSQAMIRVFNDDLFHERRKLARQLVVEQYDQSLSVERMLTFYNQIIEKPIQQGGNR